MKTTRTLSTLLSVVAAFCLISACKGPQGDPGPAGTQGPAGPTGTAGAQGPMGNANVVYTAWKTPAYGRIANVAPDKTSLHLQTIDNSAPALTQDAIDKAAIFTYVKFNELFFDQVRGYYLSESITSERSVISYFKIPGRTTTTRADYSMGRLSFYPFNKNYLEPLLILSTDRFDSVQQKWVSNPELADKSLSFYQDLLKSAPQYRVVVVYGNVPGRQAVDFSDYAAVKKAFNLPD